MQKNCSYHNVNKSVIDISWFDTSTGGLLVPEGIIGTVVGVSALTWVIKYIYYWNWQFLIINKDKVFLPQT